MQARGVAEADASFDVDGWDARPKPLRSPTSCSTHD